MSPTFCISTKGISRYIPLYVTSVSQENQYTLQENVKAFKSTPLNEYCLRFAYRSGRAGIFKPLSLASAVGVLSSDNSPTPELVALVLNSV